jgi:hypothetical protein
VVKKSLLVLCVLSATSALSSGCGPVTSESDPLPKAHETKLVVRFSGNPSGSLSDPLPNEIVDVTVDGVLEGTATELQDFYELVDTGKHVISMKSHLVNSSYSTTHQFPAGEVFTYSFNCGDAHVTFNADAAWALANVTKLYVHYSNKKLGGTLELVPGEQAKSAVDVQAGSIVYVTDQDGHSLKQLPLSVPYDATTPYSISYP